MTNDTDRAIAQIKAALDAGPTPGVWYMRTNRHPTTDGRSWGWLDLRPPGSDQRPIPGLRAEWERGNKSEANVAYIAACNPSNIRTLLSRIDAQAAEIERLRTELGRARNV